MELHGVADVYTDAGVCNPGYSWAGSWAYVMLGADGAVVEELSGPATAHEYGVEKIENNFLETLALVVALERMPDGWAGRVWCDNQNAVRRIFDPAATKFGGVPEGVRRRVLILRRRLGRFSITLLSGHPTQKELRDGVSKEGRPVSRWNVRCDELATAVRKALNSGRRGT